MEQRRLVLPWQHCFFDSQEAADDSCQDLEERLKEATESVKQLKHQLGKTKYQHKEMEDSFQALRDEKEAALNKASCFFPTFCMWLWRVLRSRFPILRGHS